MPENPSPFDDPFADLYGQLPDARRAPEPEPALPPTSRRAARAARAQDQGDAAVAPPVAERAGTAQTEAPRESVAAREPAPTRTPTSTSAPAPGTLDDLFDASGGDGSGGSTPRRPKKRRRIGGWIALGVVLVLLGGVAAGGLWVWNTYEEQIRALMGWEEPKDFEAGTANGETTITIASGDTGGPVSQKLYDAGVTKTPDALYDYMIDNDIDFTFQPGVYRLQLQMTSAAVLEALADPANKMENTAQLREGLTVAQTLTRLAEQLAMPIEDFQAAVLDPAAYGVPADSLEGWLFPATYTFDEGVTATDIIARMVARTVQSLDQAGVPEADRQRVLTVASIIQREARFEDDFYKVSRVIQNRLDQGMKLQMDSTAQFGYGELHAGSASTSGEAQFDDNPWNTYVIDGLPVGPIANPGDLAIDAAMSPAEGPWLFFVTVNLDTGETVFTTNADDHQRAVDQWISWCRDNPDAGC